MVILLLSVNRSIWNKDVEDSGSVCSIAMLVVFLTANKSNSLITFVLGIPYERMIVWHALWALTTAATVALHLYCAFFLGESDDRRLKEIEEDHISTTTSDQRNLHSGDGEGGDSIYGLNASNPNLVRFCLDGDTNTTGTIALLAMTGLILFSIMNKIRRWAFELWYIPHVIGALVAGIFAVIHGAGLVIFALAWWAVDLATRYILMAGILYPNKASIRKLPGDIVEISFPKPDNFEYQAGQYVMIAIPKLGFGQFHPFTISSSPHQNIVTMHVKALGRWSRRLAKLTEKHDEVAFLMEGPYGKLMIELENKDRYKMILFIAGGIGVTPLNSIANDLLYKHQDGTRALKKIHFVWAIRSLELMRAMNDNDGRGSPAERSTIFDPQQLANEIIDLNVYLTKGTTTAVDEELDTKLDVVKEGRPNLDEIFKEMKQTALKEGESHVAVLVCGPSKLVDSCHAASHRHSDGACTGGVVFDFHEETFEL